MTPLPLPAALKAARKAAGLTQAQVAAACGWDPPSRYANYEQGIREPSLEDLRAIAKAVAAGGHTFARIVTGEDVIPASQPPRLTAATISRAVQLMREATEQVEGTPVDVEADPELFAEMLRLAIMEQMEELNGERGVQSAGRPRGGIAGAAREAEAGDAARVAAGKRRKRA